MNKEQKELIQSLLGDAYTNQKEGLARLRRNDDSPYCEAEYQKRMKLIEETFKEVEKL